MQQWRSIQNILNNSKKDVEYVLLYADHSIVKTLPGSCKDFILNEYKKELGKVYSKIYFYLCSKTDFERVAEYADTDDDELAPQLEMTDTIEVSDDDKCEKKTVEAA